MLIEFVGGIEIVTRDTFLGVIVFKFATMLCDSDDDFVGVRSHSELTVLGGHRVIGFICAFIKYIGKGVIAIALLGLGASNRDGHALAIDKAEALALRGYGDSLVGERIAIIGLSSPLGGQGHRTLGNLDALRARGVLTIGIVGSRCTQHHVLVTKVGQRNLGRITRPSPPLIITVLNV